MTDFDFARLTARTTRKHIRRFRQTGNPANLRHIRRLLRLWFSLKKSSRLDDARHIGS